MSRRSWVALAGGALVVWAFWPLLADWAAFAWFASRLSYTLAVPVLAAILAVPILRAERAHAAPDARGAWILSAAALLLLHGSLTGRFTLPFLGFPLAVGGLVAAWGGPRLLARLAGPWLFLFLMVPPPVTLLDRATPSLVEASGSVAVALLRGLDPATAWSGSALAYRGWTVIVAEACSGSGTLLILVVTSLFLAGLFRLGPLATLAAGVLAVPLAVLVNGLRIATAAACLDWFGPRSADGVPHEILGQALTLGAALITALALARLPRRGAAEVRT